LDEISRPIFGKNYPQQFPAAMPEIRLTPVNDGTVRRKRASAEP
jgi:hypothetical protein